MCVYFVYLAVLPFSPVPNPKFYQDDILPYTSIPSSYSIFIFEYKTVSNQKEANSETKKWREKKIRQKRKERRITTYNMLSTHVFDYIYTCGSTVYIHV